MSDEKGLLLPTFGKGALDTLGTKTPASKIKQRPGASGMSFNYVEVGYVIGQLDKAFGRLWDFEILEQQIGKDQVWVRGRLTAHIAPNFDLKKDAYGGSDIKKYKSGEKMGETMDIANDLKSATSDALKKSASLFGVARDVYFPKEEI